MDGHFYSGKHSLLDFNEKTDTGFVMSEDHLIYGASCGFRILDVDDLAAQVVKATNRRGDFITMFVQVWMHYSLDTEEIATLLYGERLFGGFVTRIELRSDERGRATAKVWGGHQGIAVSKNRPNTGSVASALWHPVASAGPGAGGWEDDGIASVGNVVIENSTCPNTAPRRRSR